MGRIFERAEQYLDQIDSGEFVEIGTSRNGDDGSTITLAEWASRKQTHLYTVDMDPVNCEFVKDLHITNCTIVNSSGEDYLYKRIYGPRPISFLYLDNFDWDWHPQEALDQVFIVEQKQRYRMLGHDMNNMNSQRAHLTQAMYAVPHMAERSLIVCDDTWFNKYWGHYSGKSGSAIPYLLNQGYHVLDTAEHPIYGTILGRGIV